MKTILTSIFILISCFVSSQTKEDVSQIINLVIQEYNPDSTYIYNRFKNTNLLSDIERRYFFEIENLDDERLNEFYVDTLAYNLDYAKKYFKLPFYLNLDNNINKTDNKRINKYTDKKVENNRKKRPIAFISYPLISVDNKKAVVYGAYVCGGLCGSGGIFFLEKIDGFWKIINYQMRWVS